MDGCDGSDKAVYTAEDIETGLSHLAHWYETPRSGEQDWLDDLARAERDLFALHIARATMRLSGNNAVEFSPAEVLALFGRLKRTKKRAGDGFRIRPKHLVASMRALRTRKLKS